MDWYAHSGKTSDKGDWQRLKDHLIQVAQLAAEMAKPFGLERSAFVTGLLHDLGKYHPFFQQRLEGANIRIDHSTAGAQVLRQMAEGRDRAVAEIISYGILGHHSGLPDRQNDTDACLDSRMGRPLEIDPAWQAELAADLSNLAPDILAKLPNAG